MTSLKINSDNNTKIPLQTIKIDKNKMEEEKEDLKELPENLAKNKIQNVSQSQDMKMEIDDPFNMKSSVSTQDSSNIHLSTGSNNKLFNNINTASSCIIPGQNNNVINFPEKNESKAKEEEKKHPPLPFPLVHPPIIETSTEIPKKNQCPKEKEIFKFTNLSEQEKIAFNVEYLNDLYSNLLDDEKKMIPLMGYMSRQNEINPMMRTILIDWLIDVHFRNNFKEETIYQTVFILDAYSSKVCIQRARYQLVGVAALLIACKENEIFYPSLDTFLDHTANAYTKEQLKEMENDILRVLCFDIRPPSANDFFSIVSLAYGFNQKQIFLGKYFINSTLIDYELLKYPPAVIGVSCAYFVMKFFKLPNYQSLYSKDMVNESNPEKVIKEAAKIICHLVKDLSTSNFQSTRNKYSTNKYLNVAQIIEEENNQ